MKNKTKRHLLLLACSLLLITAESWAQAAASGQTASGSSGFYSQLLTNGLLLFAGAVLLGALFALVSLLNSLVRLEQLKIFEERGIKVAEETTAKAPRESLWDRLYARLTRVVPVEKEEEILFDHEYDGIRELDNSLPPWWVYMFYLSILFAGVYMTYYHFAGIGLSQEEQYELEMEQAQEQVQAYLARQANTVDETNVEMLDDEQALSLGKTLYETNCVACHGIMGEGGVGPNLTDEYWIHGGSIKDVFKTIKYGVPEKGMIAWQAQLRPQDMHRLASYVMTLQGTNPPNAKEPQGEKYEENASDSTNTTTIGMIE